MQKADKIDLNRLAAAFEIDFQKSDFPALVIIESNIHFLWC